FFVSYVSRPSSLGDDNVFARFVDGAAYGVGPSLDAAANSGAVYEQTPDSAVLSDGNIVTVSHGISIAGGVAARILTPGGLTVGPIVTLSFAGAAPHA